MERICSPSPRIMSNKIRAVVFEDEFFVAKTIEQTLAECDIEVVESFFEGETFLNNPFDQFDFALIDIHLSGEVTGIDIARKLNELNIPFAFLTANTEASIVQEASKTWPVTYVSKPFNTIDIRVAVDLIVARLVKGLLVKTVKGDQLLPFSSIRFIKSDDVYVEIHTETDKYLHRELLKNLLPNLPPSFIRVHRSYVVNKNHITKISGSTIHLQEDLIPISKSYRTSHLH